jgi:hypothetical protein
MHLGTLLVLVGTILCSLALAASLTRPPHGSLAIVMLSVGAALIGLGVLLGAPKIVTSSG